MNIKSKTKVLKEGGSDDSPSLRFKQNKTLGIILFLIAMSAIAFTNIIAKWASTEHHTIDILFYRNFVALLIVMTFIKVKHGSFNILKTSRPFDHIKRGIVGTIGVGTAFAAFAILPATEATVLLFTIPIFTALLSIPMLGEKVGITRWSVILIGFVGVYIAVNPTNIDINWKGFVIAMIASIASAMTALYVRDLGKSEPAERTVFYFLLIGTIITLVCMPFLASTPTPFMLLLLILAGIFGFFNQILKTNAYAIAPAALLSPFVYTMLIWSVLADIVIWNTMPTREVLLGGTIIIASNVFLAWRERKVKSAT